jgi:hypothetical protein
MRFRQCMTRGMTYIKMYIIKSLRDIGYEIYKKTSQKVRITWGIKSPGCPFLTVSWTQGQKLSAAAQTTLLYAKFRALGHKIRPLAAELEKRCKGHRE